MHEGSTKFMMYEGSASSYRLQCLCLSLKKKICCLRGGQSCIDMISTIES